MHLAPEALAPELAALRSKLAQMSSDNALHLCTRQKIDKDRGPLLLGRLLLTALSLHAAGAP